MADSAAVIWRLAMPETDFCRNRRSVRSFRQQPVEKEKIEAIIDAVLRAPSSRGRRPCHFIVVSDKEMLGNLSKARPAGATFLRDADIAIVVCADPAISGLWREDCAIAAVTIQYAASSMGLGSCWAHMNGKIFDDGLSSKDYITELLKLPPELELMCIVGIGYSKDEVVPYEAEKLKHESVSFETFGRR